MTDIDFLKQEEIVSFIRKNAKADINKLLLNPPLHLKDRMKIVVDQILARQKASGKLNSWIDNNKLIFPPPLSIEQASSITTSEYKKRLLKGNLLVDLTGGSGIDCLALSENFRNVIYVEQNQTLCEIFKYNTSILGKQIAIRNQKAEDFIHQFEGQASFFIDPSRRDLSSAKVFKLEDCTPNIKAIIPDLKSKATNVLIKLSPLLDLTKTLDEIPNIKEVYILAIKNDCKELLLLLDFQYAGEPVIHAINLETLQQTLTFYKSEEANATPNIGDASTYLYEPNVAILKSGAFKTVTHKLGVHKIAPNTHLYSSDELVARFPGKSFEILHREGKKEIGKYNGTINVLTRNYPLDTLDLKKRFQLKDGSSNFLIGFRDRFDKPQLIIAKRLY